MPLRRLLLLASVTLAAAGGLTAPGFAVPSTAPAQPGATGAGPDGSFALRGAAARAYTLPDDVGAVGTSSLGEGRTATRYQQVVDGVPVYGGQVTVVTDAAGEPDAVIGAHFTGLRADDAPALDHAEARAVVQRQIGDRGRWSTRLRLDPRSSRLFYEVDSVRPGHRPVRWVDAQTGQVRNAFDGRTEGEGVGVKGDAKPVDSTPLADPAAGWLLRAADGRRETFDAGNQTSNPPGRPVTDADDRWTDTRNKFRSPDQRAAVDAHYYAGLVDDFYRDVFGRDSLDDHGMPIVSSVHFGRGYCDAFWNGVQMTYGDGDGKDCLPLSGALDVVAHELSHGVMQYTANLTYEGESGALNESFSDIMAATLEFYAARRGADPAGSPDWRIGEDVVLDTHGFRSMADPGEFGDPAHYADRYLGSDDNGGVHTNSGIPNHAFYLATAGPDGVGVERAARVFYEGFTSLPEYASMCDARNATVAVAGDAERSSVSGAWSAVGVDGDCTPGSPPPPPCVGDAAAAVPFGSPHPYGNNGDCTWTYDHGSAGFAFHFSVLQTEAGYDYVYVTDGGGNVLARYDGDAVKGPHGLTSPCIPTSSGSVRLVTDAGVAAAGFTVDAVESCTPR